MTKASRRTSQFCHLSEASTRTIATYSLHSTVMSGRRLDSKQARLPSMHLVYIPINRCKVHCYPPASTSKSVFDKTPGPVRRYATRVQPSRSSYFLAERRRLAMTCAGETSNRLFGVLVEFGDPLLECFQNMRTNVSLWCYMLFGSGIHSERRFAMYYLTFAALFVIFFPLYFIIVNVLSMNQHGWLN